MSIPEFNLIISWKVCEYIRDLIWLNVSDINALINGTTGVADSGFDSNAKFCKPIIGDYDMVTDYPTCTIFPDPFTISVKATNYTLENVGTYKIEVLIKNAVREFELKYLNFLGNKIISILLAPQNVSPTLHNTLHYGDTTSNPQHIYNFNLFGQYSYTKRDDNTRGLLIPVTASQWLNNTFTT
jgi:hypothetical protein